MSKKDFRGINSLVNSGEKLSDSNKAIAATAKKIAGNKPISATKRIKATVLVMLSHDYNHFEASVELSGEDIQLSEIDNARKDCQRLADKAVGQYKTAKEKAAKRLSNSYDRMQLQKEVAAIKMKKEEYLTPDDKAKIKALEDFDHQHDYDYDDDYVYQHKDH
jgi:hypothetical protein